MASGVETLPLDDTQQVIHVTRVTLHVSRYTCHASRASHRDRHGLVTVGPHLYAVGGSRSIGSERSIEMFDGTEWVEVGETDGFR